MPEPTEILTDWKAKTDAATPGEWGAFQRTAEGVEFDLDADMATTTSSVECITDLRAEDGIGRVCITIADPIVSAPDAEFIAVSRTAMPRLLAAVEAIRALHTPALLCGVCRNCEYRYPCATVRAIESALEGGDDAE